MLNERILFLIPYSISSSDLPTPEKIILFGSALIVKTLWSSPPETISKPQPIFLRTFRTERLLNDLTEKQIKLLADENDFKYALACRSKVFFE